MLNFHSAYTIRQLKSRELLEFVTQRDTDFFFQNVLVLNPTAYLQESQQLNFRSLFRVREKFKFRHFVMIDYVIPSILNWLPPFFKFLFIQCLVIAHSVIFLVSNRKSVIRAEDPRFNGLLGMILKQTFRKQLIIGVWGNPARIRSLSKLPLTPKLFRNVRIEASVEKHCLQSAELILVQNEENAKFVLENNIPRSKIRFVGLGATISDIHILNSRQFDYNLLLKESSPDVDPTIVCVSRLETLKHVDHAINAFYFIWIRFPNARLIICGDGAERNNLTELGKSLGLSSSIEFLGNVNQSILSQVYQRSHLVLAPLCGRALLESSLYGIPAVPYDVDWHSEVIRNGHNGVLVKNLDSKALGQAARKLLENYESLNSLSQHLKEKAHNKVSLERFFQNSSEFYNEIIAKS